MTEDYLVEAITRIANHPEVIKYLESHIAFPMQTQEWMVKRILYALELLQNEWELSEIARKSSESGEVLNEVL